VWCAHTVDAESSFQKTDVCWTVGQAGLRGGDVLQHVVQASKPGQGRVGQALATSAMARVLRLDSAPIVCSVLERFLSGQHGASAPVHAAADSGSGGEGVNGAMFATVICQSKVPAM